MSLTSERLDRIQPSLTIAISTVARRMIAEGKNVISLSQGEPDFDTPRNIKDAAIRAIEAGETKYTDVSGTPALRKAVAAKFARDAGLDYKPEEIIISTGAKQVLFNAMVATLTSMPFILSGSLTTLSALDFLGFGLPPGSPSLGELVLQGKNNLQAPWLGITAFLSLGLLLMLLVFVGEAVRDAFDPRKLPGGGR